MYKRQLADQLPSSPVIVLADDLNIGRLLVAELQRRPGAPAHVVLETRRGPDARYRAWLAERARGTRPELKAFAEARENVAGILTDLLVQWSGSGFVRYLNPSFGFFFENLRLRPNGILFTVEPAPSEYTAPAPGTATLEAALAAWEGQSSRWDTVVRMRESGARDARELAEFWSRAGNSLGVALQRGGRLEEAGRVFGQSKRLNPDNQLADLNGKVNVALRAGQVPSTNLIASLSRSPLVPTLNAHGPVDEPVALLNYGRALLNAADRLPRQAWEALHRSAELTPDNLGAQMGEVEALLQGGQVDAARRLLDDVKSRRPATTLSREDVASLTRLEIFYALARQDLATAEKLIEGARGQFASDTSLLDLLSALYFRQGRLDEAVPLLEQWRKLRMDDPAATIRLTTILMSRNQFDQALRMLDQFLAQKADNQPARINRAICLLRLGRLEDSRREYQSLVDKLPGVPLLHYGLGEIAVRQKDTNQALVHFDEYLKVAPTNTTEYAEVSKRVQEWRGGR